MIINLAGHEEARYEETERMVRTKGAFTLIELVIVILVVGILAAVAIPKLVDIATQARQAKEDYTVTVIQTGIELRKLEDAAQNP
jgi:MSHA pilin protein MshA